MFYFEVYLLTFFFVLPKFCLFVFLHKLILMYASHLIKFKTKFAVVYCLSKRNNNRQIKLCNP